jgi:hypothetical protein
MISILTSAVLYLGLCDRSVVHFQSDGFLARHLCEKGSYVYPLTMDDLLSLRSPAPTI